MPQATRPDVGVAYRGTDGSVERTIRLLLPAAARQSAKALTLDLAQLGSRRIRGGWYSVVAFVVSGWDEEKCKQFVLDT